MAGNIIEFGSLQDPMHRAILANINIDDWGHWQVLSVGERVDWRSISGIPAVILHARYPEPQLRVVELVPDSREKYLHKEVYQKLGKYNAALTQAWYLEKTGHLYPVDYRLVYMCGTHYDSLIMHSTQQILDELQKYRIETQAENLGTQEYAWRQSDDSIKSSHIDTAHKGKN
jgi:hypothetical protein